MPPWDYERNRYIQWSTATIDDRNFVCLPRRTPGFGSSKTRSAESWGSRRLQGLMVRRDDPPDHAAMGRLFDAWDLLRPRSRDPAAPLPHTDVCACSMAVQVPQHQELHVFAHLHAAGGARVHAGPDQHAARGRSSRHIVPELRRVDLIIQARGPASAVTHHHPGGPQFTLGRVPTCSASSGALQAGERIARRSLPHTAPPPLTHLPSPSPPHPYPRTRACDLATSPTPTPCAHAQ